MNLKDFYLLSQHFVKLIEELDPTPHYNTLIEDVDSARQNASPEVKEAIDNSVNRIVELNRLFEDRISKKPHASFVLDQINVSDFLGVHATDLLLDILENEAFAGTAKIKNFVDGIAASKNRLQTIVNTVKELGLSFEDDTDKVLLSIEYTGDYSVENTLELKNRIDEIQSIVRAFARLVNEPKAFEKPTIRSISKSSPLIIDLSSEAGTGAAIILLGKAIEWAMDRIEQQYDIRIKKQKLEKENMTNATIRRGFDDLEKKQTSKFTLKQYAKKLIQECNPTDSGGAPNEIEKDLTEAMVSIVNMVDKGAMITAFIPENIISEELPVAAQNVENVTVNMSSSIKSLKSRQDKLRYLVEQTQQNQKDDEHNEGEADNAGE